MYWTILGLLVSGELILFHSADETCPRQDKHAADLNSSATATQARGQWGDDYDGGGPGWGYYYGGSGSDDDGFGSSFGNGIGIDYAAASRYRTAHGALAALAFVGLFPIGAIVMRLVPGRLTWLVHGIFQLVAYAVFISAAALGIYLVRMVRIPPDGRSLVS